MSNQEKQIQDILEVVSFIKDNAATKDDLTGFATKEDLKGFATKDYIDAKLEEVRSEFDEKLDAVKDEILNRMDMFIGLHQKLDIELTALRSKYDRLETSMKKVLEHLNLSA
jgi:hypothetical protein